MRVGVFRLIYDPSEGESERWYVNDHTFVRDHDGVWHLIGITHAEPMASFDELHLAHATAPSLLGPWTKQPFALSADGSLGETHLWAPHVIEHDGRFWMFYCAGGAAKHEYRIHLATSDDCWTWTRHPANPLVVDGFEARDPMVVRVGDRWLMYYTATSDPAGGNHVVVATESTDLVHWSGRHVVYVDPMVGTMAGPTESPFVVERDRHWYLVIGPDWESIAGSLARDERVDMAAYRRSRVLASDDPLHFSLDGLVGHVDSHAAEIVRDGDAWWISHCGWGQGGVHLAPLRWDDAATS